MASLERQYFWCCTLSKDKPEVKWLANKDNESGEVDVLNQLALGQACLGLRAQDGNHVVQVTTKGANDKSLTTPIVILGPGTRQVQCRLEFSSAATFRLIEGNGPVYLAGSHIQVLSGSYENSDEESDGDSDEQAGTIGTSIDVSPKKPSPTKEKRLNTRTSEKARPPAKKAKLEIENGDAESSDDEPDKLVPLLPTIPLPTIPLNKKDEKAKETKGKDDKAKKKPVVNEAKQKKAPISAAKKAKMDVDESEDDEDDSEDDDDDGDDDLGTDDDDDEDDDDEDDDESDDDDDDDDENDEDFDESDDEEEEEESDEESNKKATPSSKAKPQRNAKNTPTPKNRTPGKQTPKKGNMDALITITKTPDLNDVKQKLLKSPNLPKKIEKFKNFMRTNMRISDEKVVKDLWTFVQSNKK